MSDLRVTLAERVTALEILIESLGAEVNAESEAVQNKKLEIEKANKELAILLKTVEGLDGAGL